MRLIDADALAAYFKSREPDYYHTSYIVQEITAAPTVPGLDSVKEQEPVKPSRTLSPAGNWWENCGACDSTLLKWYTYCPECGRKVKRND